MDEKRLQIRNGTNDFLIFSKENGGDGVDVLLADENVWLTQKSMCSLYETVKSNVSEHLSTIFNSGEFSELSTVRNFRTVASNGKPYDQKYYNLQAIIAVGFKANSEKAVRFRAWAARRKRIDLVATNCHSLFRVCRISSYTTNSHVNR